MDGLFSGKADGKGASFSARAGDSDIASVSAGNSHCQTQSETDAVI